MENGDLAGFRAWEYITYSLAFSIPDPSVTIIAI